MAIWDTKKLYDRVIDLLGQREKGYVKFNKARDTIVRLMRPDLGSDITPDGDGSFFGDDIYDGIGSWSIGIMSRGFQGGIVSADADWIDHGMNSDVLDEVDEISLWIQEIKKHMTGVFKKSNFYTVLPQFTKDGVSIGSPLMFIEEVDVLTGEIAFLPQHYKMVFIFYDNNNKPEGVIVKDEHWTVKKITDKFAPTKAEQDKKLPQAIRKDIEAGQYYKEHTVYRAVFKSDNPVWDVKGFNKPSNGDWISVYFIDDTPEESKNEPLSTEKYFSQPFVVWDYDKKPWESVSRTPAFDAVHDVLQQQEMSLDQSVNRKLKNNPPRAVLADHRHIVDFNPEGITPVEKSDWGNLPVAIDVVGDIRLSREELEFEAEKVKRWFFVEQFLKFTDLTNTLRQQPTATQIIKIAAELAVQVNPGIATYTIKFLTDVDARMIDLEYRAGRGPFNPERMAEIEQVIRSNIGENERIEDLSLIPIFTGPLAKAQKVKQDLDPILEGLGITGEMAKVWDTLPAAIDEHGTLEDALKAIGFPMKRFKSKDEYDEIVAAIREAEAAEKRQLMAIEAAKMLPAVSGPVDETSVLAKVGEAAG